MLSEQCSLRHGASLRYQRSQLRSSLASPWFQSRRLDGMSVGYADRNDALLQGRLPRLSSDVKRLPQLPPPRDDTVGHQGGAEESHGDEQERKRAIHRRCR